MIIQIQPWIDEEELIQLKRVVDSTFVVEHKLTKEFEEMTKQMAGSKHAIAMTNGTVALYCCLKALNIGPGDEVIVPDMTFIATANAVIMAGATPVFADVEPDTFCFSVTEAEKKITPRTKCLMPVHLYGQAADMDKVMALANKYDLKVIEDAAQGVGVRFNGKHVGTFGHLGILSYYGNKTITCGEGGVVLTDDDELAKLCYRLKNHGRDVKGTFMHEHIGFNFSFTEMQAAIGIAQMIKLERIISRKKQLADRYYQELSDLPRFKPAYIDLRCTPVFWFTSFLTEDHKAISEYLLENGIQTRRFFYPLHLQPCYKGIVDVSGEYPVTERIYNQGISLPSSYGLTDEEQTYIIAKIKAFYADRD
ncbi:MAG: DegT/DnrJ/EryC1/StrS family aminotransferase [Chitinophagales bacterium]|nr:DegT/DnrJ/EryC1/StrS family aminotransferase [Chitinophagales bacterium]